MTRINSDLSINQKNQGVRTNNKLDTNDIDKTNIYDRIKELKSVLDPRKNNLLADDDIFGNSGGGFPINVKGMA